MKAKKQILAACTSLSRHEQHCERKVIEMIKKDSVVDHLLRVKKSVGRCIGDRRLIQLPTASHGYMARSGTDGNEERMLSLKSLDVPGGSPDVFANLVDSDEPNLSDAAENVKVKMKHDAIENHPKWTDTWTLAERLSKVNISDKRVHRKEIDSRCVARFKEKFKQVNLRNAKPGSSPRDSKPEAKAKPDYYSHHALRSQGVSTLAGYGRMPKMPLDLQSGGCWRHMDLYQDIRWPTSSPWRCPLVNVNT